MLGVFDLLNKSWEVYKDRFETIVGIAAIPLVANFLIAIPLIIGSFLTGALWKNMTLPVIVILSVLAVILGLAWIAFVIIWPAVAMLYAIKGREEEIGLEESFRKAWPKIASYFWINLLSGLAVLVGLILVIIPGIIFAVWFVFSNYVLVVEGKKGTSALSRSKELVQGNWLAVFGRIAFMGVVGMVIGGVLGLVPFLGPLLTNLLLTPFSVVFFYMLYEDLKQEPEENPEPEPEQI